VGEGAATFAAGLLLSEEGSGYNAWGREKGRMSAVRCPKCNAEVAPGEEFCPECHALVARAEPREEAAKAKRSSASRARRPGEVSRGAVVWLCICLFVLGFALGYWVRGASGGARGQWAGAEVGLQMPGLEELPPGHPPISGTPQPAPPLEEVLKRMEQGSAEESQATEHAAGGGVQGNEGQERG